MVDRAKKISELTAANSAANTDYLLVVTNTAGTAVTKRINYSNFLVGAIVRPVGEVYYSTGTGLFSSNTFIFNANGVTISTNSQFARVSATVVSVTSLSISGLTSISNTGLITAPQVGNIIPFYFGNQAAFPAAATYHGAIAHSHSDGKMYFAHGGSWNAIVSDGTTANVSGINISSNTINLNGVTIARGDASTRLGVNTQIGSAGSNGSIYLSTAGKIYLKVANTGVATDDWQRVTTTSVD